MKKLLLLSIIGFLFSACTPKINSNLGEITFDPISQENEILVLQIGQKLPQKSFYVGDLNIGDSGFSTDCGYSTVIENAKSTARKSGANLVVLTEMKTPNMGSSCFRIKAKMFRNLEPEPLTQLTEDREKLNKSRLPADANYSVVYFYRPSLFQGSIVSYKIRMNDDTVIGKMGNGKKFEYKTSNFGKQTFWAKTESRDSVIIDIKKGQEYFVRCGTKLGAAVGKPDIYMMENYFGIQEYEEMK